MKIRSGFVSNSSSSSFICCYAKVKDLEKAQAYIREHSKKFGSYGDEPRLLTTKEALEKKEGWDGYGADWAGVFLEPDIDETNWEDHYLVFESYGGAGDGDSDFMPGYPQSYDMDYDVDYSDFEDEETSFIDGVCLSNGFEDVHIGYGAGRNG